ncbi:MAG: hypothetical protein ACKPIC_34400, partial [Microcystis panniformis]
YLRGELGNREAGVIEMETKILSVEDHQAIGRLLSDTPSADNYTVDVAAEGKTNWETIKR